MTPLELSYPLTGLVLALGGGVYVWQSRRSLEKKLAQSQNSDEGSSLAPEPIAPAIATVPTEDSLSQGEIVHAKGKLRRLEKDLETAQANLQTALAEKDELCQKHQSQEKMLAVLQHQLAHYDDIQSEKFVGLQKLNQELLQENTNLSDRLKQAVNEVAETRPKLLQLQSLETINRQLTEQLSYVEQNQEKAIANRLEIQAKAGQEKEQQFKNQIAEGERQVQSLTIERDQALQSLQRLTEQSQSAQEQRQTLQSSLEQLTQAEQQWQEEQRQLKAKLNQLEDSQKQLALANVELKLKLETTQAEGDRLKAEKKEQGTALQSAQAEIAQLQQKLADQEQANVTAKTKQQPPVKPAEKQESAKVVTPPQPEPVAETVETKSVAAAVNKPQELPVVEAKTPKTETKVQPQSEEKPAESPVNVDKAGKTDKTTPESSEKVAKSPTPAEKSTKKVVEVAEIAPVSVPPEPAEKPVEAETTDGAHPLADKKIVILGTLNAMNREEAKTRLQDVGAECTSAPSSKTHYVVVGKAPGAKLKKAQKLGIPQLSEAQFLDLLEN